jgi:hypothetical protein
MDATDHDQRLKTLLKEFFAEFMQLFFPDWAGHFDFRRVEWLDQELFLDQPEGSLRRTDLVAKVPTTKPVQTWRGLAEQWIILIHVEIEGDDSVEPLRPRMYDYYRGLRGRHNLPVLPIGLYLRVGLNGIGWDVYEERFWDHLLVHFEYPYIGLPALDAVQYLQGTNWLGIALAALMKIKPDQRTWLAAQTAQRLARCPENPYRRFLLWECAEAYQSFDEAQKLAFNQLLETTEYKEAKEMVVTTYERGQRDLLERLLTNRFGKLTDKACEQLRTLPTKRILELSDAMLTATSLGELGLDETKDA